VAEQASGPIEIFISNRKNKKQKTKNKKHFKIAHDAVFGSLSAMTTKVKSTNTSKSSVTI